MLHIKYTVGPFYEILYWAFSQCPGTHFLSSNAQNTLPSLLAHWALSNIAVCILVATIPCTAETIPYNAEMSTFKKYIFNIIALNENVKCLSLCSAHADMHPSTSQCYEQRTKNQLRKCSPQCTAFHQ